MAYGLNPLSVELVNDFAREVMPDIERLYKKAFRFYVATMSVPDAVPMMRAELLSAAESLAAKARGWEGLADLPAVIRHPDFAAPFPAVGCFAAELASLVEVASAIAPGKGQESLDRAALAFGDAVMASRKRRG
jgi:hypothetical protein